MQLPAEAGAVTPDGVRTGDAAALAALCDRRGATVLAYCREVCTPADAPLAAAEALARFRAAVWASGGAADLDPERLLLSATRHAAAARARPPADAGTSRRILGRGQSDTCSRMPSLIVARAENLLGSADLDRMSRHVDRCSACRSTEAAFRRAERAYVSTTHPPLDSATTALFLAALAQAAPVDPIAEPVAEPLAPPLPEPPTAPTPAPELHPEAEALPDELDDHDEDGWTGEPEMIEPGPATWAATEEQPPRRRRLRVVLPAAVLAAGAVAAMAIAGVFDGSGGSSTVDTRTVQSTSVAPVTTNAAQRARRRARERRAAERRRQARTTATVTATP